MKKKICQYLSKVLEDPALLKALASQANQEKPNKGE